MNQRIKDSVLYTALVVVVNEDHNVSSDWPRPTTTELVGPLGLGLGLA